MSKLIIHKALGRMGLGLRFNEEIAYKESIDSIRFIDTFYMTGVRGKQNKSYMGEL